VRVDKMGSTILKVWQSVKIYSQCVSAICCLAILHTIEYNNLQPTKIPQQVTTNTISQSIQSKDKVVQTLCFNDYASVLN